MDFYSDYQKLIKIRIRILFMKILKPNKNILSNLPQDVLKIKIIILLFRVKCIID